MTDVNVQLAALKAKAKTGLDGGTWFATIPENKGIEIFGSVVKMFQFETGTGKDKKTRNAAQIKLLAPVDYTMAQGVDEKRVTAPVSLGEGENICIEVSGQLGYVWAEAGCQAGFVVYLQYMGKDESVTIQKNHPHTWTYSFVDPATGEV
jgi:predicted RNA-binding protein with TRAM domain